MWIENSSDKVKKTILRDARRLEEIARGVNFALVLSFAAVL